jgi:hypothetical protein
LLIIPIKFAAQFYNRADQKNNFADQKISKLLTKKIKFADQIRGSLFFIKKKIETTIENCLKNH